MDIYIIVFILSFLLTSIRSQNSGSRNAYLCISFLILFAYTALRVNYGADYPNYENIYNIIHEPYGELDNFISERGEIGYVWLNKLMPSFRALIIFQSGLFILAYYLTFKRYSYYKDYRWAFLIMLIIPYSLMFQMSGIRSSFVTVALMLLVPLFINKSFKGFIWYTIVLYLLSYIHTSAIFLIPIYFIISPRPISNRTFLSLSLGIVIYSLVANFILYDLVDVFVERFFPVYTFYTDSATSSSGFSITNIIFMVTKLTIFILTLTVLKEPGLAKSDYVLIKLALLYSFILITPGVGLSSRFLFYFAPFLVITAPFIARKIKTSSWRIIYILLFAAIFLYQFYYFTIGEQMIYYSNYESILSF